MKDVLQWAIDHYETRDQLIQKGIWKGELYHGSIFEENSRGWLWKALLLYDENNSGLLADNSRDLDLNHFGLVPVPILTDEENDAGKNSVSVPERALHSNVSSSLGIRRLTPIEAVDNHPLSGNKAKGSSSSKSMAKVPEDNPLTLRETLEIIDLDLSRIMLDDIFQEPRVHAQMRQLLYNYLLIHQNEQLQYKQGFHEILSVIYLQLYHGTDVDNINLQNVLIIFNKLMNQIEPIFYNEENLINWDKTIFTKVFKICLPDLFTKIFYQPAKSGNGGKKGANYLVHSNLIWLIRWTRLLFLRELPLKKVLIIWDHVLTFNYPLEIFIACFIIALFLSIYDELHDLVNQDDYEHSNNNDEFIELILHFKKNFQKENASTNDESFLELCKITGNLCELWYGKNHADMRLICDTYINASFGIKTGDILSMETAKLTIDPNRQSLENKLKERVRQTLLKNKKK
ncbi:hypothetical protein N7582_003117 [Saccharomyces uvarum]|uniref:Rab-GAP TBC domain-containing protein n=1 Tax=Saccharomyces uvarum TaxID=230603 RepID=A0AA35NJ54_SACUV|nr:hypothetical protein N7582_003117 [Saccharomyces uvarum]CAI4044417.1 hypothetical protein SUVC_10G1960 [Saccharomyces uvarum]